MASSGPLARASGFLKRVFTGGVARADVGGNFWLPMSGGFLPPDAPWNFFQLGWDPIPLGQGSIVAACVAAYAQTVAMCPGTHWRKLPNNGRERVSTSALSRILRRPNDYLSASDFFLNLTDQLYRYGNAYAVAVRNDRYEIAEVHLMDARISQPRIAVNGEVFYAVSGNPIVEKIIPAAELGQMPARDVLHIKLNLNPANRLIGESPLTAAMLDIASSNALVRQALTYVQNQGRPSGIITTDKQPGEEEVRLLRARWEEMTRGRNAGNMVVLTNGYKWEPSTVSSRDEQLAELLQISDQRIATAFRMPLSLLSLATGTAPQGATGDLMNFWIETGLGFALSHIADAVGRFFGLKGAPDEYLELDVAALMRSNRKDRIEALARGVQGGIYSPNEARAMENLPEAVNGDEPRVQQQVVPLSFEQKPTPAPTPPATPPTEPPDPNEPNANAGLSDAIRRRAAEYRRAA